MLSNKEELTTSNDRLCYRAILSIWCSVRLHDLRERRCGGRSLLLGSWKDMRLAKSLPVDVEVTFNVYDASSSSSWPTYGSTVKLLRNEENFQGLLTVVERDMVKGGCELEFKKEEGVGACALEVSAERTPRSQPESPLFERCSRRQTSILDLGTPCWPPNPLKYGTTFLSWVLNLCSDQITCAWQSGKMAMWSGRN